MTAQQLKNSILQMAVQGKLVPQDPNDEPASVLLERIRAEKEELIKAGKIKKDKKSSEIFRGATHNLPYAFCEQIGKEIRDISDEIPFKIPDSWEWCRLSDITIKEIKRGKSPVYADSGSVLVFAQKCNVKTGGINISLAKYLADSAISKYPQEEYMQNGDIIVNSTGTGTLGRIGMYSNEDNYDNMPLVPDSHVTIVRVCSDISQYTYYILKWYQPYLEESGEGSTKQKELKADRIKELFIPIPPLSEQHRIVAKIEELLPFIDKYGKAEEHLTALNTTFPEALKKSILQEAVQGKLVPQNHDDEPASVLLEHIRAEKQALIKAGKIKRDKHESVIVKRDKIPYEIPDNWEWCTLNDVVIQVADIDHKMPPTVEGEGFPYVSPLDFIENGIDFSGAKKIGKEDFDKLATKIKPKRNDIIFPRYGTIGVIRLVETDIDFLVSYSCCTIQNTENMDFRYIYHVLKSPLIKDEINKYINKTTQPNVGLKSIKSFLFPLPPLAEQKRIVEKIEELMQYCDKL